MDRITNMLAKGAGNSLLTTPMHRVDVPRDIMADFAAYIRKYNVYIVCIPDSANNWLVCTIRSHDKVLLKNAIMLASDLYQYSDADAPFNTTYAIQINSITKLLQLTDKNIGNYLRDLLPAGMCQIPKKDDHPDHLYMADGENSFRQVMIDTDRSRIILRHASVAIYVDSEATMRLIRLAAALMVADICPVVTTHRAAECPDPTGELLCDDDSRIECGAAETFCTVYVDMHVP